MPDNRSIEIADKHGIDITDQRSRQFLQIDFERFDHILVMDKANLREVLRQAPHDIARKKVTLILDHDEDSHVDEVPDPYYDDSFQRAYDLIYAACNAFVVKYSKKTQEH